MEPGWELCFITCAFLMEVLIGLKKKKPIANELLTDKAGFVDIRCYQFTVSINNGKQRETDFKKNGNYSGIIITEIR